MTEGKIWIDGSLVEWDKAHIHILTHALHYGTAVFEGIRCYHTASGLAVFRLSDHIQRLIDSGKIYFMDLGYSKQQLQNAIIDTINANKLEEYYIRPIAYYGYGKMGVNPLPNRVSVAIIVWKWDEYIKKTTDPEKGMRLMVSSWMKIDSKSMPIHAKATANYANSALARIEALNKGFDEAILLNSQGNVTEASAENIFMVKDDVLVTPPVSCGALNGITRDTILSIAKEYKLYYEVRDISRDELYICDEIFLTGTASGIQEVTEIDKICVGNGKVGQTTKLMKKVFDSIVHGNNRIFSKNWLTFI
jgi:branched-chain amino acid aminotransferase